MGSVWKATEAVIGITDFAQDSLGDVVFVELPAVGTDVTAGKPFGVVECEQERLGPLRAGLRTRGRRQRRSSPTRPKRSNHDPYGAGWMIRVARGLRRTT